MAKQVWLIRHSKQQMKKHGGSWQVDAPLKKHGSRRPIQMAARYFKRHGVIFNAFWHSSLVRAEQTCGLLRQYMGSNKTIRLEVNLGPGQVAVWDSVFAEWMARNPGWETRTTGVGPAEWSKLWPILCKAEGERVLIAVERIARKLKDGESAAAISHNPLIQLAESEATGKPAAEKDLKYGQAVCFTFQGDKLVSCECHLIQ